MRANEQVVNALEEGNAALRDANTALRELVISLQNERRLLLDKNHELEAKLGLHLSESREIQTVPRSSQEHRPLLLDAAKLPQEIVLRICLAVIPVRHQYDSSILAGPRSPWMKSLNTRKSLTLVCRAWNGPASEALYTDIVFRRMGQISALARTFRASAVVNAPHRVMFVKSIYMNCCAVMSSCENVVMEDLAYLLQQCTELQSFMFRPHPELEYPNRFLAGRHPSSVFNAPWFLDTKNPCVRALGDRCASGLQEFVYVTGTELTVDQSLGLLRIAGIDVHLKSLTLSKVSLFSRHSLLGLEPVELPCLEELQIHLNHDTDPLSAYISESWTLPVLERLTLVGCNYFPETLLTAHGLRLKYLHLHFVLGRWSSWCDEPTNIPFSLVGRCCPVLEHLVMPFLPAHDPLCTLYSYTLRYLDLWSSPRKRRVVELWGEMGRASQLPELVGVRVLPATQLEQLPVDLPRICHPADVGIDEVLVRTFPCVRVLQTSWALLTDVGHDRGVSFVDEGLSDENGSDAESSWYGSQCGANEGAVEGEGGDGREEGEGGAESRCGGDVGEYDDGTSWVSESDAGHDDATLSSDDDNSEAGSEEPDFDRDMVLERFTASQRGNFSFNDDR